MDSGDKPSKRRKWLWGAAIMLTGIIVAFLYQLFGPNPRIVVSEDTTVITSPLGDDGLPDYQAYWRELGREGVTHENNGAVLFWQAVWPGDLKSQDRRLVSEALGFENEPDASESLQPSYSMVVRNAIMLWRAGMERQEPDDDDATPITSQQHPNFSAWNQHAEEVFDFGMNHPWSSETIPPLADWIANNEKPFDLLQEAALRSKWWSPSPSLLTDQYAGGIAIALPHIQSARDVARAFCVRSMWHAGEGRYQDAWADLMVNYRLARFVGEGHSLIGQLVAIAIDGITLDKTVTLLQHGELDAGFARQVLDDLMAMKGPSDMVRSLDKGERIMFADMVLTMARDGGQLTNFNYGTPLGIGYFEDLSIDWNVTLREGNRWHDKLVAAASLPTRKKRVKALADFDDELSRTASSTRSPFRFAASFMNTQVRSSLVSDTVLGLMLSAVSAATNAEDRANAQLDLTRVAAALAVFRAEQGEYPEKLEQLMPAVVAKVPTDLYSEKPFIYKRMPDGGYLLYSVFENGKDDGGSDLHGEIVKGEWVEEAGDANLDGDLVIRVPLPKFELPEGPEMVELQDSPR
jgi:hypothetical protein